MFSSPDRNVEEFGFMPGERVADFGSGAGHYALALSRALGPTGRVYAIDIKPEALTRLKGLAQDTGLGNIDLICGDIDNAGGTLLKDAVVDGVVLSNILFQLTSVESAVAEAKRVLKPGGKMCVVEWSDTSPIAHVTGKKPEDIVTSEEAERLFTTSGFTLWRKFDAGEHHYGFIFTKQ